MSANQCVYLNKFTDQDIGLMFMGDPRRLLFILGRGGGLGFAFYTVQDVRMLMSKVIDTMSMQEVCYWGATTFRLLIRVYKQQISH